MVTVEAFRLPGDKLCDDPIYSEFQDEFNGAIVVASLDLVGDKKTQINNEFIPFMIMIN